MVTGQTSDDMELMSGTLRSRERSFLRPLPSENLPKPYYHQFIIIIISSSSSR